MADGGGRVTRVEMPDGTPVWARISGAEVLERPSGELTYADVGAAEQVAARVEDLKSLVTSVARSLAEPLRAVRPDEVSVEFSIELTAKPGRVVGLIADGEAKGGITVTLTWNGGPPDLESPAAATGAPGHRTARQAPPAPAQPPVPAQPPAPPVPARPPVPVRGAPIPPARNATPSGEAGPSPAVPSAGADPGAPERPDGSPAGPGSGT